jgi:hypothetical protein
MKFNTNLSVPTASAVPNVQVRKPVVVCCIPGKEFTPGFFDSWTKLTLATSRGLPFDIIVSRHYSPVKIGRAHV